MRGAHSGTAQTSGPSKGRQTSRPLKMWRKDHPLIGSSVYLHYAANAALVQYARHNTTSNATNCAMLTRMLRP